MNYRPMCTHPYASACLQNARYTSFNAFNPIVIGFQKHLPSVRKINNSSRLADKGATVSEFRRGRRSDDIPPRAKTDGDDAQTQTHVRPISREIIGSPG